tara:strand:- start:186 stop:530 length:345 start_codon:yes stop_codon:yes gene_type:complete
MLNKNILITIIIYLYFILTTIFIDDLSIKKANIVAISFLLTKWIFNYRKCSFSYIECKIRNIKKEKSHIYNYCEFFGDLIYSKYNDVLFLLLVLLLLINIFKVCKNLQNIFKLY